MAGGGIYTAASILAGNTYIISYGTKNSSAFVIAGTVAGYPKQGKTANGWTYFEHKITGQTGVTINGSGFIDELRLYPDGSAITTYAFDPAAGMTEAMDAKGQVSHFEYDGLMRLVSVKDQNRDILKNYQYNYTNMTQPNELKYGYYTRNNCPAGSSPSAAIYVSVPASTYYSYDTLSANAAAQADLDYNAQNYANLNCTCTTTMVTVTLTNTTGVSGFQAYFPGVNSFPFLANGTTTIQVPAGTYDITINPINAPTNRKFTISDASGGGTTVTQPGVTFYGKAVSTGVNSILKIEPATL